jgi:hypothetical protein
VIRHLRDSHADRELLAMKVRVLVARAYKRAEDRRERLREAGLDVPDFEPGSQEAYDDLVFRTYEPKVRRRRKANLRVLPGQGQEGSGPASGSLFPHTPPAPSHLSVLDGGVEDPLAGVAAAGRSDTGQALRHGGKPPLRSGESVAAHPQNFETEESK